MIKIIKTEKINKEPFVRQNQSKWFGQIHRCIQKNSMMLIHAVWLIVSTWYLDFFWIVLSISALLRLIVLIVAEHQTAGAVDGFAVDFDPQNWYSCCLSSDVWPMRASTVSMVAHNSSPGAKMMWSVRAEQMVSIVNGPDQFL